MLKIKECFCLSREIKGHKFKFICSLNEFISEQVRFIKFCDRHRNNLSETESKPLSVLQTFKEFCFFSSSLQCRPVKTLLKNKISKYSPKWSWLVVDIYLPASQFGTSLFWFIFVLA